MESSCRLGLGATRSTFPNHVAILFGPKFAITKGMLCTASRWAIRRQVWLSHGRLFTKPVNPVARRCLASVADIHQHPKPGESIHGFHLKRSKFVPELQLTAFDLVHQNTGAEYLHIARDDQNNVFSVGFKTNPTDDTGVPHILEHTTLCGSQK